MSFDRRAANLSTLKDASDIQDKTKQTIFRIQRNAAETEEIGAQTLEQLRQQGAQMDDINNELDAVSSKLDQSQALQSRFDRWAGNWLGGKKNKALKEAANEIAKRSTTTEFAKVKEVFQHEKYDLISRSWKKAGLVLCTDPTVPCDDVFDPAIQESITNSRWQVDFSLNGIDADGWTYAYDFATLNRVGAGDSKPTMNSYVRRRKWRFMEQKASAAAGLGDVVQRNEDRKDKAAEKSRQADRFGGYVPRNKTSTPLQASGLTSTGLAGRGRDSADQQLDEDSAAGLAKIKETDAEIDQGIDQIANTLDRVANIAGAMKEETAKQNAKLEKMDEKMQRATEKQTIVNARQRYLLK
jgi:hypothetical protein